MKKLDSFLVALNTEEKCRFAVAVYYWWPVEKCYWRSIKRQNIELSDIEHAGNLQPICPYCREYENHKPEIIKDKDCINNYKFIQYKCKAKGERRRNFNVLTNTIFRGSKVPLRKWFEAYWFYKNKHLKKDINDVSKEINLDLRTIKNMYDTFDSLKNTEDSNLLWNILKKLKFYYELVFEETENKRPLQLKTEVFDNSFSDKKVRKIFRPGFPETLINKFLDIRREIEEEKDKYSESDLETIIKFFFKTAHKYLENYDPHHYNSNKGDPNLNMLKLLMKIFSKHT